MVRSRAPHAGDAGQIDHAASVATIEVHYPFGDARAVQIDLSATIGDEGKDIAGTDDDVGSAGQIDQARPLGAKVDGFVGQPKSGEIGQAQLRLVKVSEAGEVG